MKPIRLTLIHLEKTVTLLTWISLCVGEVSAPFFRLQTHPLLSDGWLTFVSIALRMSSIHIYAELLLHLRQVTIFTSLGSEFNERTTIQLSSDSRNITVYHEGESVSLRLPAVVSCTALQVPRVPSNELSFRLPIRNDGAPSNSYDPPEDTIVPWSAESLSDTTEICCRTCHQTLLASSSVSSWKNLPSGNWAEMMDFWHCHKPEAEGNGRDDATEQSHQGYAANSKVVAKPGVGFVDTSYFLLHSLDCSGIEVRRQFPIYLQHHVFLHRQANQGKGKKKATFPRARHRLYGSVTDTIAQ